MESLRLSPISVPVLCSCLDLVTYQQHACTFDAEEADVSERVHTAFRTCFWVLRARQLMDLSLAHALTA